MNNFRRVYLIYSSFLVGGILMLLRLPAGFDLTQPLWLVLILLYWALMTPQYVNVGVAMLMGFVFDIVYNTAIGEHALALIAIVFFVNKLQHKIMLFSLGSWQMSLVIWGVIMCYQLLLLFIQLYLGEYFSVMRVFGGAVLSALIWIPLSWLLFNYQQKLRI